MDLGGSGDLRVLVRCCMWVVLDIVIIAAIVSSVAVGPVVHEPKTRPSLSRAQLRGYPYIMGASKQVLRRRVSNRWPVNNRLKEDQQYHHQCSDTEITGCTHNQATLNNNKHSLVWLF